MSAPDAAGQGGRVLALLVRFGSHRYRLFGLALCRIGVGLGSVLMYLSNTAYRRFLFGPGGYSDFASFHHDATTTPFVSLYAVSSSAAWFEVVWFVGLAVSLAFTVCGGRLLALAHLVFMVSLNNRNFYLLDAGNYLAAILGLLFLFSVTNAYLSPFASRVRRRMRGGDRVRTRIAAHNAVAGMIVFQACTIYVVSTFWKIDSSQWQDGTAVYYVGHIPQYAFSPVLTAVSAVPAFSVLASYGTVVLQLLAVPAVLARRRWFTEVVVGLLALMHVAIMFGMGLVIFGLTMIAIDAMLLSDGDYRHLGDLVARRRRRRAREPAPAEVPPPHLVGDPASDAGPPVSDASVPARVVKGS